MQWLSNIAGSWFIAGSDEAESRSEVYLPPGRAKGRKCRYFVYEWLRGRRNCHDSGCHGEGNYECDEATLVRLEENKQVVFRYVNSLNGSRNHIAGIVNEAGNVLGMMPHPERAVEALLGSADGLQLFQSILRNWRESRVATT